MKNNFLKLSILLLLSVVISCDNQEESLETRGSNIVENSEMELANSYNGKSASTDCHFEYEGAEGPEFWATLCGDEWVDCDGNAQSAINIITGSVVEDESINNINTNYTVSATDIYNNGHTIQFNYNSGSSASMNNIDYNLLQFHFHTGSEHTINGNRYPMEMHLVHQDPETKLLAVIGIFFKEGRKNKLLEKFMNNLPELEGDHYASDLEYKIENLLPNDLEFYTYSGSLTTPGCSEIVTWYVIQKPITASRKQLSKFKSIMHENYRPTQELNGRVVSTKD